MQVSMDNIKWQSKIEFSWKDNKWFLNQPPNTRTTIIKFIISEFLRVTPSDDSDLRILSRKTYVDRNLITLVQYATYKVTRLYLGTMVHRLFGLSLQIQLS